MPAAPAFLGPLCRMRGFLLRWALVHLLDGSMPALLLLFSAVNLVIGTAAFVVAGIVSAIAQSLGVSVAAAGQATSAYALATALLAPLLLVATGRWPRKRAIQLALAIFTVGNAICAAAPDLPTLLAGRVVMGLGAVFTPSPPA